MGTIFECFYKNVQIPELLVNWHFLITMLPRQAQRDVTKCLDLNSFQSFIYKYHVYEF